MKKFIAYFFLVFIRTIYAYEVSLIEGISGNISKVAFDSEFNVYALDSTNILYKIDSGKNVLWSLDLNCNVTYDSCGSRSMILNKQNDLLIDCTQSLNAHQFTVHVLVIRAKTSKISYLDIFSSDDDYSSIYIFDDEDNLFYSGVDDTHSLRLLRPNSSAPVLIKNIGSDVIHHLVADYEGNIYGYKINYWGEFFVITKEAKNEEIPEALSINVVSSPYEVVTAIVVNNQNDVVISTQDGWFNYGTIKKLAGGNVTRAAYNYDYTYNIGETGRRTEDWIIVFNRTNQFQCEFSYYFSQNNSFNPIQFGNSAGGCLFSTITYTSDEYENVYIGAEYRLGSSTVEYLKHEESTSAPVNFPTNAYNNVPISFMALDEDDNLWMIQYNEYVFRVEKGTLDAKVVPYFEGLGPSGIWKNPYTKEIFITCNKGVLSVVHV